MESKKLAELKKLASDSQEFLDAGEFWPEDWDQKLVTGLKELVTELESK